MKRQFDLPHISTAPYSPSPHVPRYVSLPSAASTATSSPDTDYMHHHSLRTMTWASNTHQDRMDVDTPTSSSFYNSAESGSSSVSLLLSQTSHSPSQASEALPMSSRSISDQAHSRRSQSHAHSQSLSQPLSPSRSAMHHHARRSSDPAIATETQRTLSSFPSLSSLDGGDDEEDDGDKDEFQLPLSQEPQSLTPVARCRLVRSLLRDKARTNKGKKSKYSVPVSYKGEGGAIKKRWLCLRCGYPASTSGHASRHHNTVHEVERPFTCRLPNCGHGFKRHDNQVQHEKTRHNLDLDMPGFDPDGSEWRRALAEEEAFKNRRNNRKNAGHSRQKSSMSSIASSEWYFDKAVIPSTGASATDLRRPSVSLSSGGAPMGSAPAAHPSVASDAGPPVRQDYRHSLGFLCSEESAAKPSAAPHAATLPPLAWTPRGSVSSYSGSSHRARHRQLPSISLSHSSFQRSEYELSTAELSPVGYSHYRPAEPVGPAPHFQTPNYQQAASAYVYAQHHQPAALWTSR